MGYLPAFTHPDHADSPGARHYQALLEQSVAARQRGDHRLAQHLASAAHKWAMDEINRLQRLQHAQLARDQAREQLERAWDRDRDCATVAELRERHPEFRAVITRWEVAEAQVSGLDAVDAPAVSTIAEPMPNWRRHHASRFERG
ncbi:MAG TPA: hypothetical protein VMU89_09385 [Thermomicrobiaceae bacterium]|nr:hypothetical protein [Thermomicrobiaceae bacterium]